MGDSGVMTHPTTQLQSETCPSTADNYTNLQLDTHNASSNELLFEGTHGFWVKEEEDEDHDVIKETGDHGNHGDICGLPAKSEECTQVVVVKEEEDDEENRFLSSI